YHIPTPPPSTLFPYTTLFRSQFIELVRGKRHVEVIRIAVEQRKNILVAGSTGSGKTTFINAVLHELTLINPDDRVLIIEDTPERSEEHTSELQSRGHLVCRLL